MEVENFNDRISRATTPSENLLKAQAVQDRLGGISSQTLWRWLKDPALKFPKPIYICGTRYWVSGEIDAFVSRQREKGDAK